MPKINADKLPKYRLHGPSGQAVVTLSGKDHYLGRHGTKASRMEYDRVIQQWLSNGRSLPPVGEDTTIVEMLAAFRRFALQHYRKDGRVTGEVSNIDHSIRPLKLLYGRELVRDFGPLKLQAVRTLMVKGYTAANGDKIAGLSRGVVNARVGRIKRVFRWAESQQLAPASLTHALSTVAGLQRGRTEARETEPVKPVSDADVDAALVHLPRVVGDMVRFQRLTGCRPNEVCILRPLDVDCTQDIWVYRPASHKTEHHGRERIIFIGPQAQAILRPYLLRAEESTCFAPDDSERQRKADMRAARQTRVQPSQRDRSKLRPKRKAGSRYDKNSYCRAIARACEKAGITPWAPNRLRHSAATLIRKKFGLEAAQVCLGHSRAEVSQLYAERDQTLGLEVMRQIG